MRLAIIILIFLFVLLIACAPAHEQKKGKLAVGIYNISDSDVFNKETNNTVTKLSFIVKNQESFPVDCQILLVVDHETDGFKKKGSLGILKSGSSKPAQFSFELPFGNSSIDIEPVCQKV